MRLLDIFTVVASVDWTEYYFGHDETRGESEAQGGIAAKRVKPEGLIDGRAHFSLEGDQSYLTSWNAVARIRPRYASVKERYYTILSGGNVMYDIAPLLAHDPYLKLCFRVKA